MTVVELKPDEVEFLNSLRRCALCGHLGALHVEPNGYGAGDPPECLVPECGCYRYK